MNCDDVDALVWEVMEAYDNNGDGTINIGDNATEDDVLAMVAMCDIDGNNGVCSYELKACIIYV